MAEKILRLNPTRGFYMGGGIHLVNPERPFVKLPDNYVPHKDVLHAIKTKALIDVNGNIATPAKEKAPVVEPPKEVTKEAEPVEEVKEEKAAPKAKAKASKAKE